MTIAISHTTLPAHLALGWRVRFAIGPNLRGADVVCEWAGEGEARFP